jgi:hypothetical protein
VVHRPWKNCLRQNQWSPVIHNHPRLEPAKQREKTQAN